MFLILVSTSLLSSIKGACLGNLRSKIDILLEDIPEAMKHELIGLNEHDNPLSFNSKLIRN